MSDVIERVAKAIYAERYLVEIAFGAMPAWEDVQGSDRANTFDEARTAIEACAAEIDALVERRKADKRNQGNDHILATAAFLRHAALKREAE